jgi:hypothetical protein
LQKCKTFANEGLYFEACCQTQLDGGRHSIVSMEKIQRFGQLFHAFFYRHFSFFNQTFLDKIIFISLKYDQSLYWLEV